MLSVLIETFCELFNAIQRILVVGTSLTGKNRVSSLQLCERICAITQRQKCIPQRFSQRGFDDWRVTEIGIQRWQACDNRLAQRYILAKPFILRARPGCREDS